MSREKNIYFLCKWTPPSSIWSKLNERRHIKQKNLKWKITLSVKCFETKNLANGVDNLNWNLTKWTAFFTQWWLRKNKNNQSSLQNDLWGNKPYKIIYFFDWVPIYNENLRQKIIFFQLKGLIYNSWYIFFHRFGMQKPKFESVSACFLRILKGKYTDLGSFN